jgi:hypothetical protein
VSREFVFSLAYYSYHAHLIKGRHPQVKSATLQLNNIADNQIDCEVADKKKLQNCNMNTIAINAPKKVQIKGTVA